ncbi:MAG: MarR family transcriptional regulator [Verrucomicrobia bacterium]|nr:MarR family transcriptional regulator [Verrucomicrobiota bacterium]
MQEAVHPELSVTEAGACVCAQVRRISRKLSSFYDNVLSPEGLTITQYSLLANIARAGRLSHTALAEKVGMDRTTLTRNLRPLTRARWVAAATGEDRRTHLLQLTTAGERKLIGSMPFWEEAQRRFLDQIGSESLQQLRAVLASAETAITNISTAGQPNTRPVRSRPGKDAARGIKLAEHPGRKTKSYLDGH